MSLNPRIEKRPTAWYLVWDADAAAVAYDIFLPDSGKHVQVGKARTDSKLGNKPTQMPTIAAAHAGVYETAVDPDAPPPTPPPPASGAEGRVGFAVDMGGGWADSYVANGAYHAKLLAQWDRALSWLPAMTAWYPKAWEYIDAYAIYKNPDGSPRQPQWTLKNADGSGRPVYLNYACSGGTCTQYAADVGNQGWRDDIVRRCKAAIGQGFLGVHLDDVNLFLNFSNGSASCNAINPRTGRAYTKDEWCADFCSMLEQVRAAIPTAELVHNSVWFAGPNHDGADYWSQRQFAAADVLMYERGFNDGGLTTGTGEWSFDRYMRHMDSAHKAGAKVWLMSHDGPTLQSAKLNLGGALLVSEGGDYQFHHYGSSPDSFWPGHALELGAAHGPRYSGGGNVVKRDFDKGSVVVDFGARTATIPGVS